MSVLLETSAGDIVIDTIHDRVAEASLNFIKLCKLKYYNDSEFFFVQSSFIARAGNPHSSTVSYPADTSVYGLCDTPSATRKRLLPSKLPLTLSHACRGVVSFAATKSATTTTVDKLYGSQFFITLNDGLGYLDDAGHMSFGVVTEGLDTTLTKISQTTVNPSTMQPLRMLRIRHTIVLHDPFDDPVGFPSPSSLPSSPLPCQTVPYDRLASSSEGEEEEFENLDNNEMEAKSRAQVLEMVGDIGHADLKPPENVLFVCKLNPHTDENGLHIIFSRFGPCKVNIIKDAQTGQSLCYGFVEYETKQMCERAYFKMDNALIDDRFVTVDFSQSVSKLWFRHNPIKR